MTKETEPTNREPHKRDEPTAYLPADETRTTNVTPSIPQTTPKEKCKFCNGDGLVGHITPFRWECGYCGEIYEGFNKTGRRKITIRLTNRQLVALEELSNWKGKYVLKQTSMHALDRAGFSRATGEMVGNLPVWEITKAGREHLRGFPNAKA